MANVTDYVEKHGDLPIDRFPLNELDALLFSIISYIDFGEIVPKPGCGDIFLCDAATLLFHQTKIEEIEQRRSFVSDVPELLRQMAKKKRFFKIRLKNYVDIVDTDRQIQFSAITLGLSENLDFVAFRGTDDTIVGWKEDFNLSWQVIPAENEARSYLNRALHQERQIFVGGHSKGAHLAAHAVAQLDQKTQQKIEKIYFFDGPGFSKEFADSDSCRRIQQKICRYIPEGSIIGVMLEHDVDPIIIGSNAIGTAQHNPLSWEVKDTGFVYRENRLDYSVMFENAFNTWINALPHDERRLFANDLFSVLEASGETTLSGMRTMGISGVNACIKKMHELSPKTRTIVSNLLLQMGIQIKEKFRF